MKKNKVVQLLSTFKKKEMERFEEFLFSPYFKAFENTKKLFRVLKKEYPKFLPSKVDKKHLYAELFGLEISEDKVLNKKEISRINLEFSYLINKVFEFWVLENRCKESRDRDFEIRLLEELANRGLSKYSMNLLNKFSKLESKNPNSFDFIYDYALEQEKYRFEIDLAKNRTKPKELSIKQTIKPLDDFFILQKLRYACFVYGKNQFLKKEFDDAYWENQIDFIKYYHLNDLPILGQAYYRALGLSCKLLPISNNQGNYDILKNLIQTHYKTFHEDYLFELITIVINYQARIYKSSLNLNDKALGELWKWYHFLDEKNLFGKYPQKLPHNYKNAVTVAARLGKLDWAEDISNKYKSSLDIDVRADLYKLNMAIIAYYRGNYLDAKRILLEKSINPDPFYSIAKKVLEFRITIDQGLDTSKYSYYDKANNIIKAAEAGIGRVKEFSQTQKKFYLFFWKWARKLVEFLDNPKECDRDTIIRYIDEMSLIKFYEKEWLINTFRRKSPYN